MKLYIKSDKFRLIMWLPTSVIKSKLLLKQIKKHAGKDNEELIDSIPLIYSALRTYVKEHGHFTLVDVKSSDGDKVVIKV